MIKALLKRTTMILIVTVIVAAVILSSGWRIVATNTITFDITRYALEGNTTVVSTFYALVHPGEHKVNVYIHTDSPNLQAHVEIYLLTSKGPVKILDTSSNTSSSSAEFRADNKIIYGFVVSKLEILGLMNNPYSRVIITIKIS